MDITQDHSLEAKNGLHSAAAADAASNEANWPQWNGWQLSDRWTIKAVDSRFCPTCGLGFKRSPDDGGQSILLHFSNSHAHFATVEALEAQTALYHYSYALQAYEQAFYEQQEKDQREAVSVASPTQAISCDASTTSSSTPRHPRDDSSANSDDLEGIAASKLVQVIEKPSDRPKFITKKGPTAKQPPNTNTTAKPPLSAPKPSFNLKSEPYDSAFPSLGGSDSSTATLSWAKKPAVAPSRKLDVSAPLYTPGTTGAAFSSLAVKERREADTSLHIAVTADAGGADPREKLERLEKSVEVESAADQVTDDKAKVVPSVNDASKQPAVSNEGGRRGGGGWTKKDRRAGPHVSSRGNGRGLPSSDPSSRGAGHGRSNADEADSWRRVSAKGKAK